MELREELRKAREAIQLVKKAAEAEKQAAYILGVEETQARLTKEFSVVCRDYCDISWGKALDVVGVPVDFETLKGKDKGQDKKKNSSNPTEKASDTAVF